MVKQTKSLIRAFDVLECVAYYSDGAGVTEISKKVGLDKSTTYRMLISLEDKGYVVQDNVTKKYRLGLKILELSSILLNQMELRKVSAPILNELVKKYNETVHLAILDNGEVFYLDTVESSQAMRISSHIGTRRPAHCTAVGKVILAFLPPEEVEKICREKGLKKFTEHTITNINKLKEELKKIREKGYAIDSQELHEHGICIAAPVRNHTGKVIAGISISAPTFRLTLDKVKELGKIMISAANKISHNLGYTNNNVNG